MIVTCSICSISWEAKRNRKCSDGSVKCLPCRRPQYTAQYLIKHPESRARKKQWTKVNRKRLNNTYLAKPEKLLAHYLRARMNRAIVIGQKTGSAVKDLGCSVADLKIYLETRFLLGMSWDRRGQWHIDHIIPLSKFDLTDREQFLKACHYTNLQPLWAKDNLTKGSR